MRVGKRGEKKSKGLVNHNKLSVTVMPGAPRLALFETWELTMPSTFRVPMSTGRSKSIASGALLLGRCAAALVCGRGRALRLGNLDLDDLRRIVGTIVAIARHARDLLH